jgi:hypothetical protein
MVLIGLKLPRKWSIIFTRLQMSADKNNCDIKAAKNNIIEINYKIIIKKIAS